MNFTSAELFSIDSVCSSDEDFLVHQIALTHNPDGRNLDSELLLHAIMNVIFYDTNSQVSDIHADDVNVAYTPAVGSEETMAYAIYKISRELRLKCFEDGDMRTKTMLILDMIGNYTWDAKAVLILAAFATNYGEFQLIMDLSPHNPLAESLAVLKQLPSALLGPQFKVLSLLINAIIMVTKCIIEFELLPFQQVLLDFKEIEATKSRICIATYWIIRSSLACCSLLTEMPETISKDSQLSTIAAWELSSLVLKLSSLRADLRMEIDKCHKQIETRLHTKFQNLLNQTYLDNQEVLRTLFAFKDDSPLKNCSTQAKVHISELKDKVIILLVSKPDLLPLENLHLLVEQMYDQDHPYHNKEGNYEILWVPLPSSDTWTLAERRSFLFFSKLLPWCSIRQPWLLSSLIVQFIKQEWNFIDDPLMVVLDLGGSVTNLNAIDMVFIWGAKAFPFSSTREKELWENDTRIMGLLIQGIEPLLMYQIDEGKNICMYGSNDINWIREFNSRIKEIKTTGLQLEVIYIGTRNASRNLRNNVTIIGEEKLSVSLSLTKIHLFWIRWESMIKSISRISRISEKNDVLTQISQLLEMDDTIKGWVLIGNGSFREVVKLQGQNVMDLFDKFCVWGDNVGELGLMGAIRSADQTRNRAMHCDHTKVIAYDEGKSRECVVCGECKRRMEKFIVYKCEK